MIEDFWTKAFACLTCGVPHEYRVVERDSFGRPRLYSWADPKDGHVYRTVIGIDQLNALRKHMEGTDGPK